MDLQSFFTMIQSGGLSDKAPVLFLRGNQEYPLLLCSLIIDRLRVTTDAVIESLDFQAYDEAIIVSKCATTFLGMRSYYWLHNLTALDDAQRKRVEALIARYEGPHCLIFFSLQRSITFASPGAVVVDIPDTCTKEQFLALAVFSEGAVTEGVALFAQQLFNNVQQIPFDTACVMLQYAQVLGTHQAVFIKRWLGHLIVPERSLFTLSQHLFAKNGRAFFSAWSELVADYPEVFWTSFWSEQLWRAAMYIRLMQNNNRTEAEKISYRLPFAFKNKEWSRWDPAELSAAHTFLQSTDTILKNGGTLFNLELVYAKLFAGDFAVK